MNIAATIEIINIFIMFYRSAISENLHLFLNIYKTLRDTRVTTYIRGVVSKSCHIHNNAYDVDYLSFFIFFFFSSKKRWTIRWKFFILSFLRIV